MGGMGEFYLKESDVIVRVGKFLQLGVSLPEIGDVPVQFLHTPLTQIQSGLFFGSDESIYVGMMFPNALDQIGEESVVRVSRRLC